MAILPIQTEFAGKNKILRALSEKVTRIGDPHVQELISNMRDTLAKTENGIGLAAPQVGINLRIFIAAAALGLNQTVFINPVMVKISDKKETVEEGCLSLPGLYGRIERALSVKVEAYNERGRKFKMKAEGLIAQLIQHEVGHLDGNLFKDEAKELFEVTKK